MGRRSFLAAAAAVVLDACARGRPSPPSAASSSTATSPFPPVSAPPPSSSAPGGPASEAAGGAATFVSSGPATSKAIALTFHGSGDLGLLVRLLDAAAAASAPITVFAVGAWLDENPQVARMILARGHELANHTMTHPVLPRLDRAHAAEEITACRDSLVRHAGAPGRWFRPSGTPKPTALILDEAGRAGYRTVVGYDIDPHDYQDPGAAAVSSAVASALHPGAIVSLHTGHAGTVTALPAILDAVRARKLEPVLVRDLLGADA